MSPPPRSKPAGSRGDVPGSRCRTICGRRSRRSSLEATSVTHGRTNRPSSAASSNVEARLRCAVLTCVYSTVAPAHTHRTETRIKSARLVLGAHRFIPAHRLPSRHNKGKSGTTAQTRACPSRRARGVTAALVELSWNPRMIPGTHARLYRSGSALTRDRSLWTAPEKVAGDRSLRRCPIPRATRGALWHAHASQ